MRTYDSKNCGNKSYPFWLGGASSCIATCITHPLDLVKVRMQTSKKRSANVITTIIHIMRSEGNRFDYFKKHCLTISTGFRSIYTGLTASILRQATYSTVRFGMYEKMKDIITEKKKEPPSFKTLICIATISGAIGGILSNPADLVNVRMQNDKSFPYEQRRNYKNVFHGLYLIFRNEGPLSFFRGLFPNTIRAMLITASQLSSYDQFKRIIEKSDYFSKQIIKNFTAAILAGLVATTVCSPIDVIKSRIMSSGSHVNILFTFKKEIKKEGIKFVFRGWTPSFIRLGPHTIITFVNKSSFLSFES
ncbi:hypothetical protein PORY_002766 [Pneumocystis oryctolagi]|uniref:Uncharacterized protein n=1 Tax=Pneumocystis oryctolagi TaxID=42067 RepID=A0ACB7CBI7_9ASCO|nr:hypothetical protein PORY_002766 [Pneumocystis oryctolagi]